MNAGMTEDRLAKQIDLQTGSATARRPYTPLNGVVDRRSDPWAPTVIRNRHRRLHRNSLVSVVMIVLGIVLLRMGIVRMIASVEESSGTSVRTSSHPVASDQGFVPVLVHSQPLQTERPAVRGLEGGDYGERAKLERFLGDTARDNGGMAQSRPVRLFIPEIRLDAPIVSAALLSGEVEDQRVYQWSAPDFFAAGWHYESAGVGESGNMVINGHHNAFGEVFRDLHQLEMGDRIIVYANQNDRSFHYEVASVVIIEERFQPLEDRAKNARWIRSTDDERLTLITCWPYESNTHRLIIVAKPLSARDGGGNLMLN